MACRGLTQPDPARPDPARLNSAPERLVNVFVLQAASESQVKKLEEQLLETTRRGDDLQRVLTELSVAKTRLTGQSGGSDQERRLSRAVLGSSPPD